ncbi:hypothetical protein J6590_062910 [Homalodisca vitripennis]|nr:hypothetical protein J6590_062910 [Homalodisca vitripennis]
MGTGITPTKVQDFNEVSTTFHGAVPSLRSLRTPGPTCNSIRFYMLHVRGRGTGAKLNIRIESALPIVATLCVEDSVAPPCFGVVSVNMVLHSIEHLMRQ